MNSPRTRKTTPKDPSTDAPVTTRKPRKSAAASAAAPAASPRKRKPAAGAEASSPAVAVASPKPRTRKATAVAEAPAAAAAPAPKPRARKPAKALTPTLDQIVRDAVVARLDAMKANDLKIIDVRGKTSVTDCLVIASGTSTRHVKSMGDEVVVTAKKHGMAPIGIEGEKDAEWILVDLGDTVVHVMLPKTREFYGLERLWSLAEESRAATAQS